MLDKCSWKTFDIKLWYPNRKTSEFLDQHLKPVMQKVRSYIKRIGRQLQNIPEGVNLVTADVVGLYPTITHEVGLNALRVALDSREYEPLNTEDLIKMAEFVLNLMGKSNNKYQKQPLTINLHQQIPVSSWMMYSLFGYMVKKNLSSYY